MKTKQLLISIIVIAFLCGCTEEVTYCDMCGKESTTRTLSGTSDFMKDEGILNKCRKSDIGEFYSIDLCDVCYDKLDAYKVTDPILEANGFYDLEFII